MSVTGDRNASGMNAADAQSGQQGGSCQGQEGSPRTLVIQENCHGGDACWLRKLAVLNAPFSQSEEVGQQLVTGLRQDTFRVELHAL